MRGILRRLLRAPALWYGLLGCTLLAVISILPAAMERWAPDAHLELGLTSYATVPNLEWQLLLIVLAITGVATAWHSGRIDFALLVVVCSALGSWLLYWAVNVLQPTLSMRMPSPITEPQQQSYYINLDLLYLLIGAILIAILSFMLGICCGLIGWVLYRLHERIRRRLL